MEAGKRTINDIFNQNKILEIPFFQRAYVWGEAQWERFLADMEYVSKSNRFYFLGSIILKQQLTSSENSVGDRRTLIDGQQRLTTLNIFLKVLSLKLNNPHLNNLLRLPMQDNELALRHSHEDITAFKRVMDLTTPVNLIIPDDKNSPTDQITKAYEYFLKTVNTEAINHQNLLSKVMFVGIDLVTDDDEQQIFDTINSLGVKLSTAELLKNYFFGKDEIPKFNKYWREVFEKPKTSRHYWEKEIVTGRLKRSIIDLFFYSFLQIKIQDPALKVKANDKAEYSKVESLFSSYKKFIADYKINKDDLIKEIKEYALVFESNINLAATESALPADSGIDRINALIFGLENTTLIPYILFILKNVTNQVERNSMFGYIESYIMRRMVCHANTKNYNQLFGERLILNRVLTKRELKEYFEKMADKVNFIPTDQELREGFDNSKLTNKQAAGVLYFIESKIRNNDLHSTALFGLKKYSLEHVMPKKWDNRWPAVATPQLKIDRDRKLLTLGNLTILPSKLNTSLNDATWDVKKVGRPNKKDGLIQYASGLDTFSKYLAQNLWDESTITTRAKFLYDEIVGKWAV
jgi:uncharacterized protein with ParB-like and HNH nuclease domain